MVSSYVNHKFDCTELISVQQPGQYEREYWQITDVNKREMIPQLKEGGNQYYRSKEYEKAVEKYEMALNFIDQLQLRLVRSIHFIEHSLHSNCRG